MNFDIDKKDLAKAYDRLCDLTTEWSESGRELLEDWGILEKRRRAWPWVTGLLAVSALGAWYWMRSRPEQPA